MSIALPIDAFFSSKLNSPCLYNFTKKIKLLYVQAIGVYGRDLLQECNMTYWPGVRRKIFFSILHSITKKIWESL